METARVIVEKRLKTCSDNAAVRMLSKILIGIGELLTFQEKLDEAVIEIKKSMELREKLNPPETRLCAETYFTLGNIYLQQKGKEKEALEYFLKTRAVFMQLLATSLNLTVPQLEAQLKAFADFLKPKDLDNDEIIELKEVLQGVLDKVEDTETKIREMPLLEKEGKTEAQQTKGEFDKPAVPNAPVVNLGVLGRGAKRSRENVPEKAECKVEQTASSACSLPSKGEKKQEEISKDEKKQEEGNKDEKKQEETNKGEKKQEETNKGEKKKEGEDAELAEREKTNAGAKKKKTEE